MAELRALKSNVLPDAKAFVFVYDFDASRTERNQHLVREFLKKKDGYNIGDNDYFVTAFDPVNVTSIVAVVENPRNAGTPESMAKVVNELLKNQTLGEKFAIRKAAGLF